jgi:two-component system sensor kinase FixL
LGYRPDEVLGKHFFDLLHPNDRQELKKLAFDVFAQKQPFREFENRNVHKNGRTVWLSTSGVPVLDTSGNLLGYRGADTDVTERKQAAQELRERDAQLAHVTRLATMGEMVAEISHEINQPLYAISNFVGACKHSLEAKQNERVKDGLDEISNATARASGIIRRLREFVGRREHKHQLVSIDEIIDTSLQILDFEFQQCEVSVKTEKPSEGSLVQVHVDLVQIEQVLVNLLRNALEAMNGVPAEDRRITVRLLSSTDSVEVAVEDCGVGVPEEIASRIFDTYFTTKEGGMGMGLGISKRIIEHHGGRLWYTANAQHGAIFHFSLPLAIEGRSD